MKSAFILLAGFLVLTNTISHSKPITPKQVDVVMKILTDANDKKALCPELFKDRRCHHSEDFGYLGPVIASALCYKKGNNECDHAIKELKRSSSTLGLRSMVNDADDLKDWISTTKEQSKVCNFIGTLFPDKEDECFGRSPKSNTPITTIPAKPTTKAPA